MRASIAGAGLVAFLFSATFALADEPKEPDWKIQQRRKALFEEGQKLVEKEKWKEALVKFAQVEQLKSHPRVMLWLALCEENLGHLLKARAIYAQAQVSARQANLPDVEEDATKAKEKLAPKIPHIIVRVTLSVRADVMIDSARAGHSGEKLDVDPGKHTIVVKAEGHIDYPFETTVKEGEEKVINAPLQPNGLPPPAPPPPPADNEQGLPTGAVALLISGGLAAATGAVFIGVGYAGSEKDFRGPGIGFAVAGGAALIAGGIWAGVSKKKRDPMADPYGARSSLTIGAAPTPGGAWVGLAGKF